MELLFLFRLKKNSTKIGIRYYIVINWLISGNIHTSPTEEIANGSSHLPSSLDAYILYTSICTQARYVLDQENA